MPNNRTWVLRLMEEGVCVNGQFRDIYIEGVLLNHKDFLQYEIW